MARFFQGNPPPAFLTKNLQIIHHYSKERKVQINPKHLLYIRSLTSTVYSWTPSRPQSSTFNPLLLSLLNTTSHSVSRHPPQRPHARPQLQRRQELTHVLLCWSPCPGWSSSLCLWKVQSEPWSIFGGAFKRADIAIVPCGWCWIWGEQPRL